MHQKLTQNEKYAKKMVKVRSKTVELTEENLKENGIELEELLVDGGYSSGEALAYLHEKNINAYIPNFGQYKPEREGFTFNKEENYYQCTKPEGNQAGRKSKQKYRPSHDVILFYAIGNNVLYDCEYLEKIENNYPCQMENSKQYQNQNFCKHSQL